MYKKGDLVKYVGRERHLVVEGKWTTSIEYGCLGVVISGPSDDARMRYRVHFQMANKKYEIAEHSLQQANNEI